MKLIQTVLVVLVFVLSGMLFFQAQYNYKANMLQSALQSQTEVALDQDVLVILNSDQPDKVEKAIQLVSARQVNCQKMLNAFKFESDNTWIPIKFRYIADIESKLSN